MEKNILWLVLSHVLGTVTCMFFHEPSYISIPGIPNGLFGYSMGYQRHMKNLVVGAPNGTNGEVYSCPLTKLFSGDLKCDNIKMDSTFNNDLNHTRRATDDYKFMLGATVAALNDSFVTCAPMWSGEYSINDENVFFVWGACFGVSNNGTVKLLDGLYGHPRTALPTRGSLGWRTLVDDKNGLLLISKPASPILHGDIIQVNINKEEGLGPMKSLVLEGEGSTSDQNMLIVHRNLGTALASGKFWHNETTIFAFGFTSSDVDGGVMFLRYSNGRLKLIKKNSHRALQLESSDDNGFLSKNSMFGAALCGARIHEDRYTDLLVGAPAQHGPSPADPELGAVHIYTGAFKKEDFIRRKLTIMSIHEESRFGTTIAAHDLDGDGLQEIFISAPYQNEGVLYVLSGYEINKKLYGPVSTVDVTDFKDKQIIKKDGFKLFGFSVAALSDLDNNGCDELAIGAPDSDKILILPCIPAVTLTVTTELVGPKVVPETVNEFQIKVCVIMDYKLPTEKIAANVSLENTIRGAGTTRVNINCDPKLLTFDLRKVTQCKNVNVVILGNEPGLYEFKSQAKLITEGLNLTDTTSGVFNVSWVRNSPYSKLIETQLIERGCSGEDCNYRLKMEFKWSGGEIKEGQKYRVGSTNDETLTLQITNEGRIAYTACAQIIVVGAPVDQLDCSNDAQGYLCPLPTGFMKNATRDIEIKLKTSKLTNEFTGLNVTVNLFNDCDEREILLGKEFHIDYEFETDTIEVQGSSQTRSVTEKSMKTSSETIDITHVYRISNKGTHLWKDVQLEILMKESTFIKDLVVTSGKLHCESSKENSKICALDLWPHSTCKVLVTGSVWKKQIEKPLLDKALNISSNLLLTLTPTSVTKNASAVSAPVFEKDSTFGQNKTVIILIAIIIAVILFGIFIYVLYRIGFFKRTQKEELEAEIRRRSFRSNATTQHGDSIIVLNDDELNDNDNAFLCEPSSSNKPRSSRISKRESKKSYKKMDDTNIGLVKDDKPKEDVSEEDFTFE